MFISESTKTVINPFTAPAYKMSGLKSAHNIVQEVCESRGGRPGLSVLTSLLVSVDVKNY